MDGVVRTLHGDSARLTAGVGIDKLLHQRLAEVFLLEVLLQMFVLVQDEGVVDGDVNQEPDERIVPFAAASAKFGVRLALAEDIDATHGFYVQRQHLRTGHRSMLDASPPPHSCFVLWITTCAEQMHRLRVHPAYNCER